MAGPLSSWSPGGRTLSVDDPKEGSEVMNDTETSKVDLPEEMV